ncbi:LemA family protein [Rhodococcus kronopolitis]|uniref:LemA family protein n=1 Tax=Rhodococcus kronopolitis TaxID=1460226 RepID=A0ABV9FVB3_9NOCA
MVSVVRRLRRTQASLDASRRLLEIELNRRYELAGELVVAARRAGVPTTTLGPLAGARSLALGFREQQLALCEQAGSENALSVALHRVLATVSADSTLRNDWSVQRPALDATTVEQRLAGAVRVYNGVATSMNALVRALPAGPVASAFGGRTAALFEAAAAVVVDESEAPTTVFARV